MTEDERKTLDLIDELLEQFPLDLLIDEMRADPEDILLALVDSGYELPVHLL
jgi:hypothetical protein